MDFSSLSGKDDDNNTGSSDVWLEIRACDGSTTTAAVAVDDGAADTAATAATMTTTTIDSGTIASIPALSEVIEAAEKTKADMKKKGMGMWDYSRRLTSDEVGKILGAGIFSGRPVVEDSRAVTQSTNIAYRGSCYTLTLFAAK